MIEGPDIRLRPAIPHRVLWVLAMFGALATLGIAIVIGTEGQNQPDKVTVHLEPGVSCRVEDLEVWCRPGGQ